MRLFAVPRRALFLRAALGLLTLVALQGCSDDDDDNPMDPGSQSTELSGTFANGLEGGHMSITIPLATGNLAPARLAGSALAHDVVVTGALYSDQGDTIGLTGTYNEEADSLLLTGGGYTLEGKYDAAAAIPGIAGVYSGPNGGGYFGCAVGGNSAILTMCGNLQDLGSTYSERWNMVVAGDVVAGLAVMEDGEIIPFEGTLTGSSPNRTLAVDQNLGDGRSLVAAGTVSTATGAGQGSWELEMGTIADPSGLWAVWDCENPPAP